MPHIATGQPATAKPVIGVIGGGMISQIAHLPFYLSDERVSVQAVAESRSSLVAHLKDVMGVGTVLSDYRDILVDPEIDTVIIIVPRQATGPLVLEALNAGKNVITEKPMAFTTEQAYRCVHVAEDKGLIYLVGFMKRYDAGIRYAKQRVDEYMASRQLGSFLYARFFDFAKSYAHKPPPHQRPAESRVVRFDAWPTQPAWLPEKHHAMYGWFVNTVIHDINLMRYFFGDGMQLDYAATRQERALTAYFDWTGVPVTFECAISETGFWHQGAEFIFEQGRVSLTIPSPMDDQHITAVTIDDNRAATIGKIEDIPVEWCFRSQAKAFIEHLVTGKGAVTLGKDCLGDMELVEDIWRQVIDKVRD